MYNISIIHPSRSRPKQASATIAKWLNKAVEKTKIEYILSVDNDDRDLRKYKEIAASYGIRILGNNNKTAIGAINYAAHYAQGNIFIVVSDDFDCEQGWDIKLKEALKGKSDYCVKTHDNYQKFIITLPILDRKYYERFGYIYNPEYNHLFSDSEMSCVAWMLDKYIPLDITFVHNHYTTGKVKKDALNTRNDKSWNQGKRVFIERRDKNFGITPVKELPEWSGLLNYK